MTCAPCAHIAVDGSYGLPAGTTHCKDCHTTWSGLARVHTVCCHRTFSTDGTEQRFHGNRRGRLSRCPTDDEMAQAGAVRAMRGALALWSGPPRDGAW